MKNYSFGCLSLLVLMAACGLRASSADKSFVLRSSEPVLVENTVLAPGSYEWKLLDSPSNRHIVEISDEKTHHVEAMIVAVPNYRDVVTSDNKLDFWETPSGFPRAVRSWFYPGDNYGQEFPYSEKTVLSLARLNDKLIRAPLADETQVASAEPAPRKTAEARLRSPHANRGVAQWPEGSWAVITDGVQNLTKGRTLSKSSKPPGGIWQSIRNLPLTATVAPLIGLIGLGCILPFLLSYLRRRNGQVPTTQG